MNNIRAGVHQQIHWLIDRLLNVNSFDCGLNHLSNKYSLILLIQLLQREVLDSLTFKGAQHPC